MKFLTRAAGLLLSFLPTITHANGAWDYDVIVALDVHDWRYLALADAGTSPPETPLDRLALVTVPWAPERGKSMAWFIADVALPSAWVDHAVILHVEGRGALEVFANQQPIGTVAGSGDVELAAFLPETVRGESPVRLCIATKRGEQPVELTRVWLESEPHGLSQAMADANNALNGLGDYGQTINPWKRMVEGPDQEAFKIDFDDSGWDSVNVGEEWKGDYVPAWYRAILTLPTSVAGVPVDEERPLLALDFDDPADCFINGSEVEPVEKDFRGSVFVMPDALEPGDSFTIAFRITNRWGGGKLRQATWRLASIDEGFHVKRDLQVDLNRLAVTLRAHDKPQAGWVDQIVALTEPLKTAMADKRRFTQTVEAARRAFDELLDAVAKEPVLLVPPYLQDVRPNEITICFETSAPTPAKVAFGTDALDHVVDEPNGYEGIHKLNLANLKPDTTYRYQVTAGRHNTPVHTFKTAPDTTIPFNFLVFGDNQSGYRMFDRVSRQMAATHADFVMSVGDVVDRGINWDEWTHQYLLPGRHFMAEKPSYIAMGNHEYGGYDGNGNVLAFDYYFKHPCSSPGSNQYYYSFDYANAHFVVLEPLKMAWEDHPNRERGNTVPKDDPELMWLEQDLKANQGKHDWTFVFYHEPAFAETWSGGYYDGEDFIRNAVVPIMETYDVDMVFNGHTHAYERGLPHPDWNPVTQLGNGITYIITGGAGGGSDNHKYKEWDQIDIPDHPANPNSDEPDEGEFYRHHFCDVKVDGKTLTFKAQEVLPNGRLGRVLDDFKLQK